MSDATKDPYHHGNLREALLTAVGETIAEKGVGGVSLREAARRAGVSHGAPAHHFGDKVGLLTAFTAQGFDVFGARMRAAAATAATPYAKMNAIGLEYLRFAMEERAYFEIMFRHDTFNPDDETFVESSMNCFSVLSDVAQELVEADPDSAVDGLAVAMRAWSMVHGLAILWLEGAMSHLWDGDDIYELAAKIFESEIRNTDADG